VILVHQAELNEECEKNNRFASFCIEKALVNRNLIKQLTANRDIKQVRLLPRGLMPFYLFLLFIHINLHFLSSSTTLFRFFEQIHSFFGALG
jgi:hypothetical protein